MNHVYTTTKLAEIPVTIDGKAYVLREGIGDVNAQYDNARAKTMYNKDGALCMGDGAGDLDILIVRLCLFEVGTDKGNRVLRPVSDAYVRTKLPGGAVDALARDARALCKIDVADTEETLVKRLEAIQKALDKLRAAKGASEEKNSPSSTEDGSELHSTLA